MGGLHEERFGERRRGVENESEGLGGGWRQLVETAVKRDL